MLKIEELSYRYQSRENFTLQKINLQLDHGEMLLLAGRSGCGKSTLIKAISGLLNNNDKGELVGKKLVIRRLVHSTNHNANLFRRKVSNIFILQKNLAN